MLFIDKKQVDLEPLMPTNKVTGGKSYQGNDEILASIASALQTLYDKFWKESGDTDPVTFICPAIKSGVGPGNMGGAFQRRAIVKTKTGTHVVTWCETAIETPGGMLEFKPSHHAHNMSSITLDLKTDIEQILWHMLFDAYSKQTFTYPPKDLAGSTCFLSMNNICC